MEFDSILVSEVEPGKVAHSFCHEKDGHQALDNALKNGSGGALFSFPDGLGAEVTYEISPDVRIRVAKAKEKLRDDIFLRDTLNKHDVPDDADLRRKVYAAIKEIRGY